MKNGKPAAPPRGVDVLEARFARRLVARLQEQAEAMPADVQERLRFARQQALERARGARVPVRGARPFAVGGGALAWAGSGGSTPWWLRLASIVPLVLLIGGLTLIQERYRHAQIEAAAEIDMALLADDLPPDAYTDPGFAEFLKFPE
jgi:hypothetical protein